VGLDGCIKDGKNVQNIMPAVGLSEGKIVYCVPDLGAWGGILKKTLITDSK
jgi:hypothetical protein